jgi:F0F1-type ATP synthase gamma subunit
MGNILLVYKDRIKNYSKLKKIFYTLKLVTLFKIATNKKTRKKMYKHQLFLASFLLQTNIIQSDFFLYKNTGILLFTSQKGICSNFNLLLVQGTLVFLEKFKVYNTDNIYIYIVGSKGLQGLSNNKNFDYFKDNLLFCLKKIKVENPLSYE